MSFTIGTSGDAGGLICELGVIYFMLFDRPSLPGEKCWRGKNPGMSAQGNTQSKPNDNH